MIVVIVTQLLFTGRQCDSCLHGVNVNVVVYTIILV